MHLTAHQALLIAALVLATLATLAIPSPPRLQWLPGSILCLILAFIFV